ncbi:precorrin-2 C(20)-methyltransferase [Amaricoccus sp.]|uniref:precorrin-2 C(20)-methyltransferase n=1 Tax=Amaricoccus sp. TaxID=1872485 RepID=UPI00261FB0B8|nr:precorrin-2 C(20)-methyltransferase [Amaricoccus sp.]HRO11560.1 precorrin-2 C(20)-methyltransferase [Amaricoccus sp.]
MSGRLIGVGTGPGDPELLTVKAVRALAAADVVAWFAKAGRRGNGRATVEGLLRPDVVELPLLYPVTTEVPTSDPRYGAAIAGFFAAAAAAVEAHLLAGRTVAVLSEGDPLFYGSYMHLHVRLAPRYPAEVIPGVTAMSGCWSQAGLPVVQGDEVLTVLPGTLPEAELTRRLVDSPASVIMKVGRNLGTIRRALQGAGKLGRAVYIERGTMAQSVTTPLAAKADDAAPYFSLVLVPGWEDRP